MADLSKVPAHVALIMDGNGRWAKKRFLPRVAGHKKGVDTIKKITKRANQLGVKMLTVYAFSTENWKRPEQEVSFLMKLPKEFFAKFVPELLEQNVRVETIGDLEGLPEATRKVLKQAIADTAHCTGLILNFAINYGSQDEICHAAQTLARQVAEGTLKPEDITPDLIGQNLETAKFGALANPDLIIRTSGEERLSNFLLWQAAYSEFYFTERLWPDFDEGDFDQALAVYASRQRRFGKVLDTE